MRVSILLTCGKYLYDSIISIWREGCVHKTSLTLPLCIEVSVPSQESDRSCIGVLGYRFCLFLRFCYWFLELLKLIIWLSNLSTLSVPDEGNSRNVSCALNLISTFSFRQCGIFCFWFYFKETLLMNIVSEWLMFNAKWVIVQIYHCQNKFHFDVLMVMSALYYTNSLSWIFTVLAHWNSSAKWRSSKLQFSLCLNRQRHEPMIYHIRGEHAYYYTIDAVIFYIWSLQGVIYDCRK